MSSVVSEDVVTKRLKLRLRVFTVMQLNTSTSRGISLMTNLEGNPLIRGSHYGHMASDFAVYILKAVTDGALVPVNHYSYVEEFVRKLMTLIDLELLKHIIKE